MDVARFEVVRWFAVLALVTGCGRVGYAHVPRLGEIHVHSGIEVSAQDLLVSIAQALISTPHTLTVTCRLGDVAVR